MKNKILKIFFVILFSLTISYLTYRFCYFIAEKYYFDKFFYQKSIKHGYIPDDMVFDYAKYGKRAQNLGDLTKSNPGNILGTTDDKNNYNIVIIGDSFVWGQGILNNQRFATILEKKLNKIRPTKIYSYGSCGDNLLDYYNVYKYISHNTSVDIYIFSLVSNDAILNTENITDSITHQCQNKYPNLKPLYFNIETDAYIQPITQSWNNPINQCIIDNTNKLLPVDKSIYFIAEDYDENWDITVMYKSYLERNNKFILSSSTGKNIPKYSKYWIDNKYWDYFKVSQSEGHPSVLANQMYADILFKEITTNPKWNFIK